jgi:glycoside hydrolase-like protein
MRFILMTVICAACGIAVLSSRSAPARQSTNSGLAESRAYLGFDRNTYPGDSTIGILRKTFSFTGYWLNNPPGETSNSWRGKREILNSNGFGFLLLFNGRLYKDLKTVARAKTIGTQDSAAAINAAKRESFPVGAIIFLDQEQGGHMLPAQRAYLHSWIDGVTAAGFRAGIYCSGIAATENGEGGVITANDIRDGAEGRNIAFFIYNDACPPSPGCAAPANPPSPAQSGVAFATVWQFAQSPRRPEYTAKCTSHYDADGNCYAPLFQRANAIEVDVSSATSADPSSARR